jgi:hypothetical protein
MGVHHTRLKLPLKPPTIPKLSLKPHNTKAIFEAAANTKATFEAIQRVFARQLLGHTTKPSFAKQNERSH